MSNTTRYARYAIFFDQDGRPIDEYVIKCTSVAERLSNNGLRAFNIDGYASDPATIQNGGYIRRTLFKRNTPRLPLIWKVIFNDPATIVMWADNTKTVIKCQEGDIFDPEKGLAMAMCKKMLGNKSNFNNEFKKWLPDDKKINEDKSIEEVIAACERHSEFESNRQIGEWLKELQKLRTLVSWERSPDTNGN